MSAADPHQTVTATTVVSTPTGRSSTRYSTSRHRAPERTRSTRRPHHDPACSGLTGSSNRTSSNARNRERSAAAIRWDETNSSQMQGMARGNVMSRPTDRASRTMTAENVQAPTSTSSST
jgi:hypothetical protein